MSTILHITSRAAWNQAQREGAYRPASLASEGFIHLSKPDQVIRVANAFYRDQPDLVLLHVDPARLQAPLRYEDAAHPAASEEGEQFPHLYGPLNLDAVIKVTELKPGADGSYAAIDPASL
jgi:uncharacterized protein (DUF952 family)